MDALRNEMDSLLKKQEEAFKRLSDNSARLIERQAKFKATIENLVVICLMLVIVVFVAVSVAESLNGYENYAVGDGYANVEVLKSEGALLAGSLSQEQLCRLA